MTRQGAKEARKRNTVSVDFGAMLGPGVGTSRGSLQKKATSEQGLPIEKFGRGRGEGVFYAEREIGAKPGCRVGT